MLFYITCCTQGGGREYSGEGVLIKPNCWGRAFIQEGRLFEKGRLFEEIRYVFLQQSLL